MRRWIPNFSQWSAKRWTVAGTVLTGMGVLIGITGPLNIFSGNSPNVAGSQASQQTTVTTTESSSGKEQVTQHITGGTDNIQVGAVREGSTVIVSRGALDPFEKVATEDLVDKALRLYNAKDGSRNISEAAKTLDEAVNRGDSKALTIKGVWLMQGVAYSKNPKEAVRLWEQAAIQGYSQAAFNLGEHEFQMCGGEDWPNRPPFFQYGLHRAIHWYLVAAKSGHKRASQRLKQKWTKATLGMLEEEYPDDVPALKQLLAKSSK